MQPYFFPYPGYFELMSSVDLFVFLTDVQYVKRSWINRNHICHPNGNSTYITVPVSKHKQKDSIENISISKEWNWLVDKHIKCFKNFYGNNIDEELIKFYKTLKRHNKLCPMLIDSLRWMSNYLGINLKIDLSSNYPSYLKGEERIIELCKIVGATTYVNLPGGGSLYKKSNFFKEGINLEFMPLTTKPKYYIRAYFTII